MGCLISCCKSQPEDPDAPKWPYPELGQSPPPHSVQSQSQPFRPDPGTISRQQNDGNTTVVSETTHQTSTTQYTLDPRAQTQAPNAVESADGFRSGNLVDSQSQGLSSGRTNANINGQSARLSPTNEQHHGDRSEGTTSQRGRTAVRHDLVADASSDATRPSTLPTTTNALTTDPINDSNSRGTGTDSLLPTAISSTTLPLPSTAMTSPSNPLAVDHQAVVKAILAVPGLLDGRPDEQELANHLNRLSGIHLDGNDDLRTGTTDGSGGRLQVAIPSGIEPRTSNPISTSTTRYLSVDGDTNKVMDTTVSRREASGSWTSGGAVTHYKTSTAKTSTIVSPNGRSNTSSGLSGGELPYARSRMLNGSVQHSSLASAATRDRTTDQSSSAPNSKGYGAPSGRFGYPTQGNFAEHTSAHLTGIRT